MKLVTFEIKTPLGPQRRIGALLDGELSDSSRIVDLNTGYALLLRESGEGRWQELASVALPPDMLSLLESGKPGMERARQVLDFAGSAKDDPDYQLTYSRNQVRLLAPVPRPRTLRDFSIYEEHMTARSGRVEKAPAWYHFPTCYKGNPDMIFGPEDPLYWPDYSEMMDPELELLAYVGKRGRNLTPEEAVDYIAGWTIFVDSSARDMGGRDALGPFKAKDFGSLMGPVMVTPDEFDETNARCGIRVNGETWYEGNTGHRRNYLMPDLIAYASDEETINPGDAIAAGTIGFSASMDSGRWVKPGDVLEHWIEGIGVMKMTVVREKKERDYVRDGLPGRLPLPEAAKGFLEQLRANR